MQSGYDDAADQWIRDPRTGEYRLRLPGEAVPPPPAPPAPVPARSPAAGPRRAPRRRGRSGHGVGPWLAAAAVFLLVVCGVGGYLLLNHPKAGTASSATATAHASASATCSARPAAAATEPAVSGSFLKGAKATPINVRVTVLNGTGTIGQAETVLTWLQSDKGFLRSSNGGPAPATARSTTLVYAPNHVDQARTLAQTMGLPATALHGDGKTKDAIGRMVLTLGQDFHGVGKPFTLPAAATAGCAGR